MKQAILALEDGSYFIGYSFGAEGEAEGEVVFNTSMTGYQEIITDPSYRGQIVVMTYTQIGNCGVNEEDVESSQVQVNGLVVKELSPVVSSWRAKKSLHQYLAENQVVGIWGIDTRAVVKRIREKGALKGVVSTVEKDPKRLVERARVLPDISELNLVEKVATREVYHWSEGDWSLEEGYLRRENREPLVLVVDYGVKRNILRRLTQEGARVVVAPPQSAGEVVEKIKPHALFLSNGPGDPQRVVEGIRLVRKYMEKLPIMGICLGHQIIGLALGGKTYKLKFGHHGGNHPVKDLRDGHVEITAQNHNFAVDPDTLK
ncbi:MAG: glutamine-hydrolyzing carbamoyl-phosphate synthase small subunit, partial [Aquificaceae bacterium]|nr:glutamine-hydrolyzing carbamoyl-phosphate synthase small subunit [Aquificaceae bacterium]